MAGSLRLLGLEVLVALLTLALVCACSDAARDDDAPSQGGAPTTGSAGAAPGGSAGAASGSGGAAPGGSAGAAPGGSAGASAAGSAGSPAGGASGGSAAGSGGSSGGASSAGSAGDCNGLTGQTQLTVAKDGSAQFTTVQAAIASVAKTNTTPTVIRIAPGTYTEKLIVDRPNLTLCGRTGQTAATILAYGDNANTSNGNGGTLGTSGSASVNISAKGVSAQNLTFKNNTPLGGSQAVAVLVSGSQVQFRDCRFLSYQDTLYVKGGTQYFRDCYIEGSVDFIFGAATAVFDECTMHNASGGTALTAPSTDPAVPYGLVFLGGKVTGAATLKAGSVALGRNWGAYGAATYLGTELGAHVSAVGWQAMGSNTLATARFAEFQSTGPGANPTKRAAESTQLSASKAAQYTVETIFGTWIPSFSK